MCVAETVQHLGPEMCPLNHAAGNRPFFSDSSNRFYYQFLILLAASCIHFLPLSPSNIHLYIYFINLRLSPSHTLSTVFCEDALFTDALRGAAALYSEPDDRVFTEREPSTSS